MIISISGRLGSGKDTIGKIIQWLIIPDKKYTFDQDNYSEKDLQKLSGFSIEKFADSLKDIVCRLINCTRIQLEDREFKETSLGKLWNDLTPRQILQRVGTDLFRDGLDENVWVNSLFSQYIEMSVNNYKVPNSFQNWIITDTRFPNELKAVKDRGGITIKVNRGTVEQDENLHASETALDKSDFDYIINNEGTIEELIEKVREILHKENIL